MPLNLLMLGEFRLVTLTNFQFQSYPFINGLILFVFFRFQKLYILRGVSEFFFLSLCSRHLRGDPFTAFLFQPFLAPFRPRGLLPYIRYIGMCRFGLKTGIDFEHFGLKLDMVIGGTFTKAYNLIFPPSNQGE